MAIYFPHPHPNFSVPPSWAYSETNSDLVGITEMSFFISFQMTFLEGSQSSDEDHYIWKFGDNYSNHEISLRTAKTPKRDKLCFSFTAGDGFGGNANVSAFSDHPLSRDTTYQIAGRYKYNDEDGLELLEDGVTMAVASTLDHNATFDGSDHRMVINSKTTGGEDQAGVKIENFMLWKDKFLSFDECLALRDTGYWWFCMTEEPAFWYYMDMLHSSGDILDRSSNQRNLTTTVGDLYDFPSKNTSSLTSYMKTDGREYPVGSDQIPGEPTKDPAYPYSCVWMETSYPEGSAVKGDTIKFDGDPHEYTVLSAAMGNDDDITPARPTALVCFDPLLAVEIPADQKVEVRVYKQAAGNGAHPPMPGMQYITPDPNMGISFKTQPDFTPDPPPADFVDIATVTNVPGQQQRYDIDGLEDGQPYLVRVRAVDQSGNESKNTEVDEAVTPRSPVFVLAEAVPWRTSRFFTKYKYTQQDFSKSRTS